ncbi:nitric oxide-sensing protein NosP [Methylomonas albis]|uniref:FIST C-terminal domain-containing protein n=1 Tax=Methylomonas albis TaxID=1854563 RepID=A0ABR9DAF3_9GAMM|nr:nitric oxide-sensing protein NosP [Methylomonas albis]MBD9358882.1 FIST C-terminal domain-containing protein [Methylomonas albis]
MLSQTSVRIAQSTAPDLELAVHELHAGLVQPAMALVVIFCASVYDRPRLAAAITQLFGDTQVVGCTTAGEIGPTGIQNNSLVGVSFSADAFHAVAGLITDLQHFETQDVRKFAQKLLQDLEAQAPQANSQNSFGFLLIDGLSVREEPVIQALQTQLSIIPLVGGSAGDSLHLKSTHVFLNGRFYQDSAILLLINTSLPFKIFKTQHFMPTEQRMVVTAADVSRRAVMELNGLPAAYEYARLLGVEVNDLNARHFAASPVVVTIAGNHYVRSIQRANPDQSLTFYCAIEEGLVLRMAHGVDLLENLRQTFALVRSEIGQPQLTLAFDCVLRRLELDQQGLTALAGELLRENQAVGFNTYGEQYCGVHVNQTFAAIAIGNVSHESEYV